MCNFIKTSGILIGISSNICRKLIETLKVWNATQSLKTFVAYRIVMFAIPRLTKGAVTNCSFVAKCRNVQSNVPTPLVTLFKHSVEKEDTKLHRFLVIESLCLLSVN